MHCFFTIDFICLNFRAIKVLLHILNANNILINIFADLKALVEAVSRQTVTAKSDIAVDAENILFIFSQVLVINTRVKEIGAQ